MEKEDLKFDETLGVQEVCSNDEWLPIEKEYYIFFHNNNHIDDKGELHDEENGWIPHPDISNGISINLDMLPMETKKI